ncbi:Nicotinamidase-related amidase [Tistlia consotensis]|uniref:Nicotinamidase-related amidase n=1 Tax=Tistlia consotensis USBA 355 TaxID=560819 RepID=A0A1Y6C4X7_9PROT|nr:isochorismatase family cysteine hydrolase [Tistlia consotensis]SMF45689.1 Nicotinamidase-related amidase [Tistlia consotensis USBA 355]SNR79473.1 Nicotinamidase-related amidase [Tistlia consotensis]
MTAFDPPPFDPPPFDPLRLKRDKTLVPAATAVLIVDVQNAEIEEHYRAEKPEYWQAVHERALPALKRLVEGARAAGSEVVYTVIEALTRDGRDRSLDHKLSGILVPRGSEGARVIDAVAPLDDEIVLPKTSSGIFNSTNVDYVLRNLGVENLIVAGFLTDQCVDMAVRDAADRGYYVICAADGCASHTDERHRTALKAFGGYCRVQNVEEILADLGVTAAIEA